MPTVLLLASATYALLPLQPLQPDLTGLHATGAPTLNASASWLTQMSAEVHHALVEAKALEQRVAAAAAARAVGNSTDGLHGDALLREVTFKPGLMDAGMHAYRRSLLLHELATSCRLVVVLDDPDPSSRDATFLSLWQLDGRSEPAPPVHANGGDGYRKLRMALSGLAWQKHDRAHANFAKRFYDGRVDAGFYSTRWFWLQGSFDKKQWQTYDQFTNTSRLPMPPSAPPPSRPPSSPPLRFTPPSSPLPFDIFQSEGAAVAANATLDLASGDIADTPEWPELDAAEEDATEDSFVRAVPNILVKEDANTPANGTQSNGRAHVEATGEGDELPSMHSPPVLGLQGLICYKIIALFKPGELERGRGSVTEALLPQLAPLPAAVAATSLHDTELQKLLVLILASAPLNLTSLANAVQQSKALAPLLSEPLVTEVFTDAAIYWPGSL